MEFGFVGGLPEQIDWLGTKHQALETPFLPYVAHPFFPDLRIEFDSFHQIDTAKALGNGTHIVLLSRLDTTRPPRGEREKGESRIEQGRGWGVAGGDGAYTFDEIGWRHADEMLRWMMRWKRRAERYLRGSGVFSLLNNLPY